MPTTQNVNKLKIHAMPETVYNHYLENGQINENELYIVERTSAVLSLREGGTGVAASSVEEARMALGAAAITHVSDQPTCGTGSSTIYGHVKLCDDIDSESSSVDGIAATPIAVKTALNATKSSNIEVTLEVSNWTSDNTYIISNENITETNNGIISLSGNVTDEEYTAITKAVSKASIRILSQAAGSLTLKCVSVPEINIPIIITLMH